MASPTKPILSPSQGRGVLVVAEAVVVDSEVVVAVHVLVHAPVLDVPALVQEVDANK